MRKIEKPSHRKKLLRFVTSNTKFELKRDIQIFLIFLIMVNALIFAAILSCNYYSSMIKSPTDLEGTKGGTGSYPPPIVGDWLVTTDTYVENETLLLNGNLTILSGGTLTIRNVTLMINSTFDGQYKIEIQNGGKMFIYDDDDNNETTSDASSIMAFDASYGFYFNVTSGSSFEMRNSELHDAKALFIDTNGITIYRSLISNSNGGVSVNSSSFSSFIYNTVTSNSDGGIDLSGCSNMVIENNIISNNFKGIEVGSSSDIIIKNNIVSNNSLIGITLLDSANSIIEHNVIENNGQDGINIQRSTDVNVTNNQIRFSGQRGIYLVSTILYAVNNTISNNSYGIWPYWYSNATIINSTIENSTNYDFYIWNSNPIALNTTFNKTKLYFKDAPSNLTIQWYMHVKAIDSNDDRIVGANVEVKDINDDIIGTGATSFDGYLRWIVATEYVQNDTNGDHDGEDPGEKIFFTPHNVTASKDGNIGYANPEPNMNESKEVVVRLPIAYTTYTITKVPLQGNVKVDGLEFPALAAFSWLNGDIHTISVNSPESGGTNIQYVFDYWDDGGLQTHDITVGTVDTVITAYYYTQYKPTVTLVGTDSIHTVTAHYTQDGSPINVPGNFNLWSDWCDEGTSLSYDIEAIGSSSTERWHTYEYFSVSPWISVFSAFSTTVVYYHQYNVSITTTGLASSYPATINATQAGSPLTPTTYTSWNDWIDADSTLGINETISVSLTERYHTIDTFSWAVNSPIDATVNYYHQYKPTIITNGLSSEHPATVNFTQHGIMSSTTTSTTWSNWSDTFSGLNITDMIIRSERERYHTLETTFWIVDDAFTVNVNYIHQYKPIITLVDTDNTHVVSVIHVKDNAYHNDSSIFISWSDWVDKNSSLSFDECTSGSPKRCTLDTRSWTIASAFNATINYIEKPIIIEEVNYKPFIALIFSIILLLVGTYVSYKKLLKFKESQRKNKLYTWLIVVLPFVIAEAITGIVSLITGLLSIPPLLGAGTIMDLIILVSGLVVFVLVYRYKLRTNE